MGIAATIIQAAINENPGDMDQYLDRFKQQWTGEYHQNIRNYGDIISRLESFKKRIVKTPKKNDFISAILDEQIKQTRISIKNIEEDWKHREMAFSLLSEYQFSSHMQEFFIRINMTTTTNA